MLPQKREVFKPNFLKSLVAGGHMRGALEFTNELLAAAVSKTECSEWFVNEVELSAIFKTPSFSK